MVSYMRAYEKRPTENAQWRCHGGMGGSGPPLMFRPLKVFLYIGGYSMYVYCNFYCSPAKKNGSDPGPLFWAGDATENAL